VNRRAKAATDTKPKAISRPVVVFAGLPVFLLGGFLFAGCDFDAVLSVDASQDSLEDSTPEDGIPPIDDVAYENTEVATFALG